MSSAIVAEPSTGVPPRSSPSTPLKATPTRRSPLERHAVLTYFGLTFAISLGAAILAAGPDGLPPTLDRRLAVGMSTLAGPSIAGLLLTGVVSGRAGYRELLARLRTWRVGWRWWAVALLTAPLLNVTASTLLALATRSPAYLPAIDTTLSPVDLLLTALAAGLLIGVFEELGWTGFAIPRLLSRHGVLATGLLLGIVWGAWHFMLFWERDSFSGALPMALLLVRLFAWLPAYRVLMAWAYDRTRSVPLAMLMHAMASGFALTAPPPPSVEASIISILGLAAVLWVAVAVVAVATRGHLSRQLSSAYCMQ